MTDVEYREERYSKLRKGDEIWLNIAHFMKAMKNKAQYCSFDTSTGWDKNTDCDYEIYELYNDDGDFVYLDPPYLDTTATYNENGGWTMEDEKDLHDFCDKLTELGIKWGMSNVYENKGIVNNQLKEWQESKDYNVHYFDDFTYCSCGKGNSNSKEVFITNY